MSIVPTEIHPQIGDVLFPKLDQADFTAPFEVLVSPLFTFASLSANNFEFDSNSGANRGWHRKAPPRERHYYTVSGELDSGKIKADHCSGRLRRFFHRFSRRRVLPKPLSTA